MPDFSPDFTPRYVAKYTSAGVVHAITLRGFRNETETATTGRALSTLDGLMSAIQGFLSDNSAWISAEYIPQDTNVGVPTSTPSTIIGGTPIATFSNQDKATTLGFVGRSASTPMRLFVFGFQSNPDTLPLTIAGDFRITAAESPAVIGAAISVLNGSGVPGNNNLPGAWHQYANIKVNDYWLRILRKLGSL